MLWGLRVIIPSKLRPQVLELLHESHIGITRMKALARSHVWWPGLDSEVEAAAKSCSTCAKNARDPPKSTLHSWEVPHAPWSRLNIDYAGPFHNSMWLVWVDAFTKYAGVERVNKANSYNTISTLDKLFSFFGDPEHIVSDNGTPFTAADFSDFCNSRGIRHIRSAPYHPQTNGEAERFVQTFKLAVRKADTTPSKLSATINRFLQVYRATPHSTTGRSPSELLFGRTFRTTIDLLHPSLERTVAQHQQRQLAEHGHRSQDFLVGQRVFARQYRGPNKWSEGLIARQTGPVSYDVQVGS